MTAPTDTWTTSRGDGAAPFMGGRNPGPFEGGYRYIGIIVIPRPESG